MAILSSSFVIANGSRLNGTKKARRMSLCRSDPEVAVPRELFVASLERVQRFGVPLPLVQRG